jgi:hypothetical protein
MAKPLSHQQTSQIYHSLAEDSRDMHAIYLCARYGRRTELQGYAVQLQAAGYAVTSRWLLDPPDSIDTGAIQLPPAVAQRVAQVDTADVHRADTLLCCTEAPDSPYGRGARWVEYGLALAWNKRLLVVGPDENVFVSLAHQRFVTFADALTWLSLQEGRLP